MTVRQRRSGARNDFRKIKLKRKSTPSSDGRKTRWHTRRTQHGRRTHQTATAHELTGRTGGQTLFASRSFVSGCAEQLAVVGCRCGVAAVYAPRSVPPPTAVGSEIRKREHATLSSTTTATRNRPRRRLGQGQGQQLLLLVYGSPLATFSVARSRRTANAL